tara:strand:+ start:12942 stop:13694 length:753 start_codon:yes stop_codon:yes gene_type:complete
MLFKKHLFDKIDYYLISILTVLLVASLNSFSPESIWFLRRDRIHETHGLFSLVEFIQLILLFLNIFLIFKNRKLLIKYSNNFVAFAMRIFIPILLIFEETSFFFKGFFNKSFLEIWSVREEFNIHNSSLFYLKIFNNNHYGNNFWPDDITLGQLIFSLIFILISFGGFLPYLKRFSFIFFEKRFLLFGLIYIFNIIFSFAMRKFLGIFEYTYLLSDEFIELFYYQLILFDLREKVIKSKIQNNINKFRDA